LYYLRAGKPLDECARVLVSWYTSLDAAAEDVPFGLIDLLEKHGFLEQGKKNSKSQFEYKWELKENYGCFAIFLHDNTIALIAVYLDAGDAQKHMNLPIFATTSEKGIHRVSSPWFTVGPYNIPGST
ncbi:MAG: hypothetical protein WCC57_13125, partial [Paracoccaceae bacterium]